MLILVPTANADHSVTKFTLQSRANENQCFIAYGNNAGDEFGSGSMVVDPQGDEIANMSGTEESMVIVDLKTVHDKYKQRADNNAMLACRRPDLYGSLAKLEET